MTDEKKKEIGEAIKAVENYMNGKTPPPKRQRQSQGEAEEESQPLESEGEEEGETFDLQKLTKVRLGALGVGSDGALGVGGA